MVKDTSNKSDHLNLLEPPLYLVEYIPNGVRIIFPKYKNPQSPEDNNLDLDVNKSFKKKRF